MLQALCFVFFTVSPLSVLFITSVINGFITVWSVHKFCVCLLVFYDSICLFSIGL